MNCELCNIENWSIHNLPFCIEKSIIQFMNEVTVCTTANDILNLVKKDDSIVYITLYFAICWSILVTIEKYKKC